MDFLCDRCGNRMTLDQAVAGLQNRRLSSLYLELGGIPGPAWDYLQKFKSPQGHLSEGRHLRLIEELHEIFINRQFRYRRQIVQCPQKLLFEGLREMVKKEDVIYLKNHNYLLAVLSGMVQTLGPAKAEEQAAQEKTTREDVGAERAVPAPTEAEDHGEPLTPEEFEAMKKNLPWNKEKES